MAIAASGAVSFSDLRTEFVGGSAAISYSDLYRGGSNIRAKANNSYAANLAASVPTSGTINIANFRSQAKGFRFTYTTGASAANYQNQNAATLFGDDYAVNYPKEIVINSGVELGATSTSEEALEIPSGSAGSITVTNNGTMSGAGGAAGAAGGDAFETAVAVTLINNGIIRAGGGGGGTGGQGSYASYSTPYWSGTYRWMSYGGNSASSTGNRQVAVWGGSYVVNSYTTALSIGAYSRSSYITITYSDPVIRQYRITQTTTNYQSGAAGGVGQGYNQSAASGFTGSNNAGNGGAGGSFGQSGTGGVNGNYTNGVSGGAAGNYIRGLSFVTLTQSGTVQGNTA